MQTRRLPLPPRTRPLQLPPDARTSGVKIGALMQALVWTVGRPEGTAMFVEGTLVGRTVGRYDATSAAV